MPNVMVILKEVNHIVKQKSIPKSHVRVEVSKRIGIQDGKIPWNLLRGYQEELFHLTRFLHGSTGNFTPWMVIC